MSNDTDERAADGVLLPEPPKNTSRTSRLFATFRIKSSVEPYRQPGMEDGVLNKIEKMNLRKQMDTFYTAYSKVSQSFTLKSTLTDKMIVHCHKLHHFLHLIPLCRDRNNALPDQTHA